MTREKKSALFGLFIVSAIITSAVLLVALGV
jgi:hypothetical protein